MMHDRSVQIRNPFNPKATESQWIRSQHEAGCDIDLIVENVNREIGGVGENGEYTQLVVEYVLGRKQFDDIEHLLTPYMPSSISLIKPVSEGFLCEARGENQEACFSVLLALPLIEERRVRQLVENNQKRMCYLAYKRAHEGYPAEYEKNVFATCLITHEHVSDILPD